MSPGANPGDCREIAIPPLAYPGDSRHEARQRSLNPDGCG